MIQAQVKKSLKGQQGDFVLDISINIQQGEMVAIFGPSGTGKTTFLRCLAGLEQPENGMISVFGKVWFDPIKKTNLKPQERKVGYVFQDYALFPNMTVKRNLEFALPANNNRNRVNELMELMDIVDLENRKPDTLSGGQKQKVALARALVAQPQILLLDEPFSALDNETRCNLQDEIIRLQKIFGITCVLVSHDVSEVYKLAQKVFVLDNGKIKESGEPAKVFSHGMTSGKFRFTGELLEIENLDVLFSLTVLVGNQIAKVAVMPSEAKSLKAGDRLLLVSKAFNPMVVKL